MSPEPRGPAATGGVAEAGLDTGFERSGHKMPVVVAVAGLRTVERRFEAAGGMAEHRVEDDSAAVVGVADALKGQIPVGCVVLKAGVDRAPGAIVDEVIQMIRDRIGPVAAFKKAVVVSRLPKTRSGKILRGTMQRIADSEDYRMPATIEDPDVLDEIRASLQSIGYASQ